MIHYASCRWAGRMTAQPRLGQSWSKGHLKRVVASTTTIIVVVVIVIVVIIIIIIS